jgi:hypothetical protein
MIMKNSSKTIFSREKKHACCIPEIHFIADSALHPTNTDIQP